MQIITIPKKIRTTGTLHIGKENFVVLKKEYIDELLTLLKSAAHGEWMLREGHTRSFNEFLTSVSRKRK